jgi:protein-glucosylgalactosylhydroxylysine glucosidase
MSPIDRETLVRRHNPEFTDWNPRSPLSVGNGDFSFTTDFTGLQTCTGDPPGAIPRCTMSQRGFHSYPGAPADYSTLRLKEYTCGKRTVAYMTDSEGQEDLFTGLRVNPHRFHLGKIGLYLADVPDNPDNPEGPSAANLLKEHISNIRQKLDLWTGELSSRFDFDGQEVSVTTVCHLDLPLLAIRIESPLLETGKIGLDLRFPYASHEMGGADWDCDGAHTSSLNRLNQNRFLIRRNMDSCRYSADLQFSHGRKIELLSRELHHWSFTGSERCMEFSILFSFASEHRAALPDFTNTAGDSARHWKKFWNGGAAISFEGSSDPRALELERRVILSQYLLAIQSLGTLPPAETGLTCNSWYGKYHLEMHPWHALHGLVWNRAGLVEQSLSWYSTILPGAQTRAKEQGYKGARWPKMTDPSGNDSPSPIGCLLCWQQPHLILFAELLYRLKPSQELLQKYSELIFETAVFMADYLQWDEPNKRYVLGPPVIPAQENHSPEETLNPLFELEYWRWGLKTAILWKKRLKQAVPRKWKAVLEKLSACPIDPGNPDRYAAHELCSDSFGRCATDHPSMLLACGFLPPQATDLRVMQNTSDTVLKYWRQETMWGWDFPAIAMTLARLGHRKKAVEALLMKSPKNTYMENGHNRQEGHDVLPLYLPGNGALLLAVGMMTAGWDGSSGENPGFPDDGSWTVHWEGLARYI